MINTHFFAKQNVLVFSDLRICRLTQIQSRQSDLLPQQARAGKFPIQSHRPRQVRLLP